MRARVVAGALAILAVLTILEGRGPAGARAQTQQPKPATPTRPAGGTATRPANRPPAARTAALPEPPSRAVGKRRALLVGCTEYVNEDISDLAGGGNDAALMQSLLTEKFGFDSKSISVLTEGLDEDRLPSYENIQREFRKLVEPQFGPNDLVVVYLSGHGSQQPDDPQNPDEHDGLDEVFCPRDVMYDKHLRGVFGRAITDDQIRDWLDQISANGAHVWLIADACCSGTLSRGGPAAVVRACGRDIPLYGAGSPVEPLADASKSTNGAVMAFYAAQPSQATWEAEFPEIGGDAEARKRYGLFTYSLYSVLASARGKMTYHELLQRVFDHYRQLDRDCPTPMLEGAAPDRLVLGHEWYEGRSRIRLTNRNGRLTVNGGKLNGLTENSVLAVFPTSDREASDGDAAPIGYVRLTRVGPNSAVAKLTPGPLEAPPHLSQIPATARCETVYRHFEQKPIHLAVDPIAMSGERLPEALVQEWSDRLSRVPDAANSLIAIADSPHNANWLLRIASLADTQAFLTEPAGAGATDMPLLVPIAQSPAAPREIRQQLERVARADNLIKIASEAPQWSSGVSLEIGIVRYSDESDETGQPLVPGPQLDISSDDEIGVRISNASRLAVDVTVLYIDSERGIHAVFPIAGRNEHRFQPGESRIAFRGNFEADRAGIERFVAIGVPARSDTNWTNYNWLAQRGVETRRAAPTAIDRFFSYALDGERNGFNRNSKSLDPCGLASASWHIIAAPSLRYAEGANRPPLRQMLTESRVENPDEASRALMPWQIGGPVDQRRFVEIDDAIYYTENRAEATLGAYGALMLDGWNRFERYGAVKGLEQSIDVEDMRRSQYTLSRDGLFSLTGRHRFAEYAALTWNHARGAQEAFNIEVGAMELYKADVIRQINDDREALAYFQHLIKKGSRRSRPCVILANAMILSGEFSRAVSQSAAGKVDVIGLPHSADLKVTRQDKRTQVFKSPVVRCYRMYVAELDSRGEVRDLIEYRP